MKAEIIVPAIYSALPLRTESASLGSERKLVFDSSPRIPSLSFMFLNCLSVPIVLASFLYRMHVGKTYRDGGSLFMN